MQMSYCLMCKAVFPNETLVRNQAGFLEDTLLYAFTTCTHVCVCACVRVCVGLHRKCSTTFCVKRVTRVLVFSFPTKQGKLRSRRK